VILLGNSAKGFWEAMLFSLRGVKHLRVNGKYFLM
jgi:hypothetical protein